MKKLLIAVFLIILCVGCFIHRIHNFEQSIWRSTDEFIFLEMAEQVSKDISNYNAISYTEVLKAEERYIPAYMLQPLYKHPPLFTFAAAASIKMFGASLMSAYYPALLFGVLLIPLTYLLGRLLFSVPVALLAAFYMALDPVTTITSQKIWMDTMLAFFTVLSVYWFSVGFFKEKDFYFILSGIASGLATNTKYTGYLATIAVGVYVLFYHRELFRNKTFLFSLILPLLLMIPWVAWNFQVYGMDLLNSQGGMHTGVGEALGVVGKKAHLLLLIGFIAWAAYYFVKKRQTEEEDNEEEESVEDNSTEPNKAVLYFSYGVCGLICFLLTPNIYHAFQLHFIPSNSWAIGYFHGQPTWFYFGRLVEFSFPYLFGILTMFAYEADRRPEKSLAVIATGVMIIFFISWRNYQSRYILACLPFLLLLSFNAIVRIVKYMNERSHQKKWYAMRAGFFFVWLLLFYHTLYINFAISYPNDLCYY